MMVGLLVLCNKSFLKLDVDLSFFIEKKETKILGEKKRPPAKASTRPTFFAVALPPCISCA